MRGEWVYLEVVLTVREIAESSIASTDVQDTLDGCYATEKIPETWDHTLLRANNVLLRTTY